MVRAGGTYELTGVAERLSRTRKIISERTVSD